MLEPIASSLYSDRLRVSEVPETTCPIAMTSSYGYYNPAFNDEHPSGL